MINGNMLLPWESNVKSRTTGRDPESILKVQRG